ncbi:PRD domain-containing protein [Virgibacillus halophilus]|uniref:PRD domain-containing protein n=1 Tax=Tigheibacillus halophilus TaxID=361280 RepID=A0ABU5C5C5_9BACI|nr:PRD domain-containing protein [Virgibacillus halophilus]
MSTINRFIEKVSLQFGVDLTHDELLKKSLLVHLRPAIYRMQFHLRNKNPLREEIHQRYPDIVAAVSLHIGVIEHEFKVMFNEDEKAYIALHIGSAIERKMEYRDRKIRAVLVCASGVGTSQLLKSRIERFYRDIDVVTVCSVYELQDENLRKNQIDWIISTVSISDIKIPVILVSPFLVKEDRKKIGRKLEIEREKANQSDQAELNLNELLPEKRILWEVEEKDWEESIKKGSKLVGKRQHCNRSLPNCYIELIQGKRSLHDNW